MTENKPKSSSDNYITAPIHKEFYYNQHLDLPTIVKEYDRIEKILKDTQYIACISIQVCQLTKIEYHYGSNAYLKLWSQINEVLKEIKSKEFRENDIFVVDFYDTDTFILFLSSPRRNKTTLLYHLEDISERIRVKLEEKIFHLIYPYLKDYAHASVGFALEINNPMVNNMRVIMRLVNNAKKMGEFMSVKHNFISKYTLQKIIIEEKLQTVFQPIVEMRTLNVFGYEALSRGPEKTEFADPFLLFLLAAQSGLSFELDRLCRKKALECIPRMKSDKKFFINTLSTTIHDPEFRGIYLKEVLEDLEIKPENVIFEISEKLAIDNYDAFRDALQDYTDIGIVHAGDDIGTGYSDLERIMELNPGFLKVDMSFIRGIDLSCIKQEIVETMLNLSENIGSQIIVEGIETKAEYETLKDLGVPYGQGFLFARPSKTLDPIRKSF